MCISSSIKDEDIVSLYIYEQKGTSEWLLNIVYHAQCWVTKQDERCGMLYKETLFKHNGFIPKNSF